MTHIDVWAEYERLNHEDPAALSPADRRLLAVGRLRDEVNNGGFHQYFFNSAGNSVAEALDAALAVGADDLASLIRRGLSLLNVHDPADRAARQRVLDDIDPSQFADIDEDYYALEESADLDSVMRAASARRGRESAVPGQIPTGDIHHLRLTVTDVARSRQFYTSLLGFEVAVESPPPDDPSADEVFKILFGGVVLARGNLLMGLRPMAPAGDRFSADRVGLDHLSFGVASHEDLEHAVRLFDEHGVRHGGIAALPGFGIEVLSFEDPDGVQLELTAPAV